MRQRNKRHRAMVRGINCLRIAVEIASSKQGTGTLSSLCIIESFEKASN